MIRPAEMVQRETFRVGESMKNLATLLRTLDETGSPHARRYSGIYALDGGAIMLGSVTSYCKTCEAGWTRQVADLQEEVARLTRRQKRLQVQAKGLRTRIKNLTVALRKAKEESQ